MLVNRCVYDLYMFKWCNIAPGADRECSPAPHQNGARSPVARSSADPCGVRASDRSRCSEPQPGGATFSFT